MTEELAVRSVSIAQSLAQTDEHVIGLWLHGRSPHTQEAYRRDVDRFNRLIQEPLARVRLDDLQVFADSLLTMAESSQARAISSVKSLLTFGHKIGYLAFNVGAAVIAPRLRNRLAERILWRGTYSE
jgi:integrase/recombinase XerD